MYKCENYWVRRIKSSHPIVLNSMFHVTRSSISREIQSSYPTTIVFDLDDKFLLQVALKTYREGEAYRFARDKEILLLKLTAERLPKELKDIPGKLQFVLSLFVEGLCAIYNNIVV